MAESEFADHQISLSAGQTSSTERNVEQRYVLAGEAGDDAVLVHGGRADSDRRAATAATALATFSIALLVSCGHGLHNRARQCDAGRDR